MSDLKSLLAKSKLLIFLTDFLLCSLSVTKLVVGLRKERPFYLWAMVFSVRVGDTVISYKLVE